MCAKATYVGDGKGRGHCGWAVPVAFREALSITGRLGVRYGWIDCSVLLKMGPEAWDTGFTTPPGYTLSTRPVFFAWLLSELKVCERISSLDQFQNLRYYQRPRPKQSIQNKDISAIYIMIPD